MIVEEVKGVEWVVWQIVLSILKYLKYTLPMEITNRVFAYVIGDVCWYTYLVIYYAVHIIIPDTLSAL